MDCDSVLGVLGAGWIGTPPDTGTALAECIEDRAPPRDDAPGLLAELFDTDLLSGLSIEPHPVSEVPVMKHTYRNTIIVTQLTSC